MARLIKILLIPVITATLLFGLAITTHAQPARPRYVVSNTYPILFLHGFSSTSFDDCNTSWATAKSYFSPYHGWAGPLIAVGYYTADTNCDVSIVNWSALHDTTDHCIYTGAGNEGTNNEDLRHIACELLWYIWDTYGSQGTNVQIVAHSMGGLIIRWALANHGASYPPAKYIQDVFAAGSPMGGLPELLPCGCLEASQMQTSSDFMQQTITNAQNPQGTNGTDWTMIGSNCDSISALDMDGGHKTHYYSPCPTHGNYFNDVYGGNDAVVDYSNGQPRNVVNLHSTTWAHPDHLMLLAVSGANY